MMEHGPVDVVVLAFGEARFDGRANFSGRFPLPARAGALKDQSVLTEEEFQAQKNRLLGGV